MAPVEVEYFCGACGMLHADGASGRPFCRDEADADEQRALVDQILRKHGIPAPWDERRG